MGQLGQDVPVSFYVEAEDTALDHVQMKRDVRVRLIAVTERGGTLKSAGISKFTAFGSTVRLSVNITLEAGSNVLVDRVFEGIDGVGYRSGGEVKLIFAYTSDVHGIMVSPLTKNVPLAKMYSAPQVDGVKGRMTLGEGIAFGGEMLENGYALNVTALTASGTVLAEKSISASDPVLNTAEEWISAFPDAREFDLVLRISASRLGNALPDTLTLGTVCCLKDGAALPEVTVKVSLPSDSAAVQALGMALRNQSRIRVDLSGANARYGASITECRITLGAQSAVGQSLESGILTEAGEQTYSVRVTDSRGSVYTEQGSVTVQDYGAPVFRVSAERCSSLGEPSKGGEYLAVSTELLRSYPLGGRNLYRFYYRYANNGSTVASEKALIDQGSSLPLALGLSPTSSYDVYFTCEDSLGQVSEIKVTLDCERIELNIAKNKIGIGKYAEKEYLLDCAWDIRSGGDVFFTDSVGNELSLRQALSGGSVSDTVKFKVVSISSKMALNSALAQESEGVRIVVAYIASSGLGYGVGWHVFLTYKNSLTSGSMELGQVT